MLNIHLAYNPEIPLWYLLKRNICPQKDLYMNVHSSIIQNNQIMETTQMLLVDEHINKRGNPYSRITLSNRKIKTNCFAKRG